MMAWHGMDPREEALVEIGRRLYNMTLMNVARDILNPNLVDPNSVSAVLTVEQDQYIQAILESCSSDSLSALKAHRAILKVLVDGAAKRPVISSLSPNTADESTVVELHVMGENFTPGSQIAWSGATVPTMFISDTELQAVIQMPAGGPARDIPVFVVSENNVISEASQFALTVPTLPEV